MIRNTESDKVCPISGHVIEFCQCKDHAAQTIIEDRYRSTRPGEWVTKEYGCKCCHYVEIIPKEQNFKDKELAYIVNGNAAIAPPEAYFISMLANAFPQLMELYYAADKYDRLGGYKELRDALEACRKLENFQLPEQLQIYESFK